MMTNESDSPLIDLFKKIEYRLDQMPAAELHAFNLGWQSLLAYTEQPNSAQTGMLHQLRQLLEASPTLKQQKLHILVSDISRYTPRLDALAPASNGDGMAPVRNEVVKAVHQLGNTIRQQIAHSSS